MSVSLSPSLFVKIPQFSSNELGMWGDLERSHNFLFVFCFFSSLFYLAAFEKWGRLKKLRSIYWLALHLRLNTRGFLQHCKIAAGSENIPIGGILQQNASLFRWREFLLMCLLPPARRANFPPHVSPQAPHQQWREASSWCLVYFKALRSIGSA